MTTIFTDDFTQSKVSVDIEEKNWGFEGREVTFTTDGECREFRVVLPDEALQDLADELALQGFTPSNDPNGE